ncbi:MAG: signal peptidase I [Planctomycetes bacterium]|nr:signal peptidase I [Planctomycetota bacterium]
MNDPLAPAGAVKPGKKAKVARMGPIRDNLESFGVAILAAVLLKWFCIEAYQIPTSSMQPTLMGSTEAGVYDRILVDKSYHSFFAPQRFDVTVFRYPLQRNQSYVKRILGVGGTDGERLSIAGGNVHAVTDRDGKREYSILRKPARIQGGLWKNVFPARQLVRNETKAIGDSLFATPGGAWSEADGTFTAKLDGDQIARLAYNTNEEDGGFVDRVWDGYPTSVAAAIWKDHRQALRSGEIVPDARITATLTPDAASPEVGFAIDVVRPGLDKLTYALEVRGDQGKLLVRSKDAKVEAESAAFPCAIPAGSATTLAFARLDDMLYAWLDGDEVATLDVAAWHTREGCELAPPFTSSATHVATPMLTLKGRGKVVVTDLRMDRDLHYTKSGAPDVIEVPARHYFMMGDNTLQSVDSRDWTSLTIGMTPDGRIVEPPAVDSPEVRRITGNKRPVPPNQKVDRDETPVVLPDRQRVVMLDQNGEVLALRAGVASGFLHGQGDIAFTRIDGGAEVKPEFGKVPFVREEDVVGRALLVFWPIWPFGPHRLGFIR